MSRDSSTSSVFVPKRDSQIETRENEFEDPESSALLPPPRTPLNSIPDPSQYQKETADLDFKHKLVAARAHWLSDKRAEASDRTGINAGSSTLTPKILSRGGKAHAESTSAQSTPARTGSRVSLGGPRGSNYNGCRGLGFSSRDNRGIHSADSEFSVEFSHFELEEDSSFWKDNNVQVSNLSSNIINYCSGFLLWHHILRQSKILLFKAPCLSPVHALSSKFKSEYCESLGNLEVIWSLFGLGSDTDSATEQLGEGFSRIWKMLETGECEESALAWSP